MNKFNSLKWTGYTIIGVASAIILTFIIGIIFNINSSNAPLSFKPSKKKVDTDTIYVEEKVYDTIHIKVYDTVPIKVAPPKEPIKLDTTTSKIELIQN